MTRPDTRSLSPFSLPDPQTVSSWFQRPGPNVGIPKVMPSCSWGGVEEEESSSQSLLLRRVGYKSEPGPILVTAVDSTFSSGNGRGLMEILRSICQYPRCGRGGCIWGRDESDVWMWKNR
ncbi:hypothetical protein U1Q18_032903 [Sarracenia purpurea var. burkii]